ncbi:SWIM zinc finger family protein [Streptomyces glaucosporus]|uniref:SWIM zinc finger family protein n=1 Tax=Streptomyces glaucosporus TaxID=284044 RepID=UPI0031DCDBE2
MTRGFGPGPENTAGFTEDDLRALAGDRSFRRGRTYLRAVEDLAADGDRITATVYGNDAYRVTLLPAPGGLDGRCDCPYGQEGFFCKHCVAVGLRILALDEGPDGETGGVIDRLRAETADRTRILEDWLESLDRARLLDLIREQLAADPEFARRMELRAAVERADREGAHTVRHRVLRLLDTRPFEQYGVVDHRDAGAYAAQVAEAAHAVRSLARGPLAREAVSLAQEAVEALGEAAERIDDSGAGLARAADALAAAHLEACRSARPAPGDLAAWLASRLLGDTGHLPELDPADYRDVLGGTGWAALLRHVHRARRGSPPGREGRHVLERLLRAGGGVDVLIGEMAADPEPDGSTHLRIAEELDAAGRPGEALAWAERGLAERGTDEGTGEPVPAFPPLVEYLVRRHREAGRHEDVLRVVRGHFRALGTLGAYRRLREAARAAGRWAEERPAALDRLDGTPVLVEALLDDGDADAAHDAASRLPAPLPLRVRVADAVRERRPADALAVYRRAVDRLRSRTGNAEYERMTEILLSARACHRALGTEDEFTAYLAELRTGQKRKRNLMRMLDEAGLTAP